MRRVIAVSAIVGLLGALGALLVFLKPWEKQDTSPRFVDRLPLAEVIGKTNVLDFSKDLIPTLYFYEIPFREFLSPEFILSQGKMNGFDFQKPIYFFGNEKDNQFGNFGAMIEVSDSSKITSGINRLKKLTPIKDSLLFGRRIFISSEYNVSFAFGKDWALIADRSSFKDYFRHAISAKLNTISPRWRSFLEDELFQGKSTQMNMSSERLRKYGLSSIHCATDADSNSLTLHTRLSHLDTVPISLKPVGERYEKQEFTKRLINLNLNIDRFRNAKNHPLFLLLKTFSRKISFPLEDFLKAWDGSLAFRQGGIQTISESYIESELDDNFNVTEVVKYKQVKISGFALSLSMNEEYRNPFVKRIFQKGILTNEEDKVRMLYFPPMTMRNRENSLSFYTSSIQPSTIPDSSQTILWDFNYTPVLFTLDSIEPKKSYGKVNIGLGKIIGDRLKKK